MPELTRDYVLSLPAGHEIDALCAEHVMGVPRPSKEEAPKPHFSRTDHKSGCWYWHHGDKCWYAMPCSGWVTSGRWDCMDGAFALVKKLTVGEDGKPFSDFNLMYVSDDAPPNRFCGWLAYFPGPTDAVAETPALAICRSALLCVLRRRNDEAEIGGGKKAP